MKQLLRNLALASAVVIAGAASAQTLTDNFALQVTIPSGPNNARYATGHNGKLYFADKGNHAVYSVDSEGNVATVLENENIVGLGLTFDQAGNMILQAGAFPDGKSGNKFLIATPNADGTYSVAGDVVDFGGEGDDCIADGREDVLPGVIGDVMSEQGAVFYVSALKATSVYMAFFQNGGKGDYSLVGDYAASSPVNGVSGDMLDNNTFAQPYYNSMDELMAAVGEGVSAADAFVVRKRANAGTTFYMVDGALQPWTSVSAGPTAGFARFNLKGVDYAVLPIFISATTHVGNFQVVRVSDGEVVGRTNFDEIAPSSGQSAINVEVVDENTVRIYRGCSLGAKVGVAMATFTVPSTPSYVGEPVYVMGHIGDDNTKWWNPSVGYEMNLIGDNLYKIEDVNIADADGVSGVGYFAFVNTLGADQNDWDSVNAGKRYGAVATNTSIAEGETADVVLGDQSWKIAAGNYDFTLDLVNMKLTVEKHSGVNAVEVEEGEAVYYNLQGVQVANPQNGLYIVKRGNKIAKQYIR
ncbi:MAG: hypothetical protein MR030_02725 [Bacteroidales bacterium]|nr:hypothetical protein [Bacteroidales bacterium]